MQKENYAEVPYWVLRLWGEAEIQLSKGEGLHDLFDLPIAVAPKFSHFIKPARLKFRGKGERYRFSRFK
ncbi:hypothetical protein LWE69_02445 [Paenibacillus sp. UKAQ_18]|nr:hypothetical protein [Paenibacillus sp. UKAQ_18]